MVRSNRLLSLENLRDANKVYEAYVANCEHAGRAIDLPLINFTRFLLLTLEVRPRSHVLPKLASTRDAYAASLALFDVVRLLARCTPALPNAPGALRASARS